MAKPDAKTNIVFVFPGLYIAMFRNPYIIESWGINCKLCFEAADKCLKKLRDALDKK